MSRRVCVVHNACDTAGIVTRLVLVEGSDVAAVVAVGNNDAYLIGVAENAACVRKRRSGNRLGGNVCYVCAVGDGCVSCCGATCNAAGVVCVCTVGKYGTVVDAVFDLEIELAVAPITPPQ